MNGKAMLTNDEIRSVVESAFLPLRCGVEIWDYQQKLRFRVFDPNAMPLVSFPRLVLNNLRAEHSLFSIIEQVRERVEAKGFVLEPWPLAQQAE